MMLPLVGNSLVMVGAVILAGSLIAVRQLIMQLPTGRMRRSWHGLGALIVFFYRRLFDLSEYFLEPTAKRT